MLIPKKWRRIELLAFITVTLFSLVPFTVFRFFPSMDGASHLYNSNVINQLLIHHSELFRQFFQINPEPVPNWTGHLLISLLRIVMPAYLAEKILIVFILIATPFAFRRLIETLTPGNQLFSWLIFPFSHSMFFFFGFFNFCLAVLFCLVTLNFWLKTFPHPWKIKSVAKLAFLVGLTYFSHIVIFGVLLILISLHVTTTAITQLIRKPDPPGRIMRRFIQNAAVVFVASVIPLLLFGYFFYSRPGARELQHTSISDLFMYLVQVRPLISFNPGLEGRITIFMFFLLTALLGAGLVMNGLKLTKRRPVPGREGSQETRPANGGITAWWLFTSLVILLIVYFVVPDSYGSASYTNLRIGLMIYLVAILLIATTGLPWWVGIFSATGSVLISFLIILVSAPTIYEMSRVARSCNDAAKFIPDHSVVLPVYCMDNWFTGHFVDYLAVDKPVVMVYNYECESGYFPVKWNHETRPNFYLGNPADTSMYLNFELYKGRQAIPIDYVFVVGKLNRYRLPFFRTLQRILLSDFVPLYLGDYCTLYRRKGR